MSSSLDQAVRDYLVAKEAAAVAEAAKKAAEASLKLAYAAQGIDTSIVDGVKVKLVASSRSSYDAEALQALIAPSLYKKVTKPSVDAESLKSAIGLGLIQADVADAITKTTEFVSFRTTPVSVEAKSVTKAAKVA
jgi:hypothetical protein